jgi:hypothetical protein
VLGQLSSRARVCLVPFHVLAAGQQVTPYINFPVKNDLFFSFQAEETNLGKNHTLVNILLTKQGALPHFVDALRASGRTDIADHIEEKKRQIVSELQ